MHYDKTIPLKNERVILLFDYVELNKPHLKSYFYYSQFKVTFVRFKIYKSFIYDVLVK